LKRKKRRLNKDRLLSVGIQKLLPLQPEAALCFYGPLEYFSIRNGWSGVIGRRTGFKILWEENLSFFVM
jgi:hypothetical protein